MAGNIKGIIVEIGGDTSGLQKALSKVNSATSGLSKELKGVNSLLKLDPSNTELVAQKQELLSNNIEETNKKLKLLQDIQKQANEAMVKGAEISKENYRNLQREIVSTQNKLNDLTNELKQCNTQNSNWTKAGKKVEDFGNKVTKVSEKVDELGNKLSIASAGVIATGTILTNNAMDMENAVAKYISITNTAEKETEKYRQVLEKIHDNNYGENYEDIANSMAQVRMQLKEINEQDLQNITEKAIVLRDLFGYEVAESVRAVKALMDNFNISADESFNLISEGKKQGLDFSNELLDNINEYSVQFKKLGLTAEDMFNIFKIGSENGAFNLDKIGDAVKEFSIRAIDGSKTTIDGFKKIGLNADEMAKKFANGGETAKQAFIEVVNRLANMDDKVSQSMAGVDLFGTMWEDLGPIVISSFSKMDNGISKSSDSMKKSIDKLYNTTKKKAETQLKRLQSLGADFGEEMLPVLEDLINMAEKFISKLDAMSDAEKENLVKIGLLVAGIGPLTKTIGTAGKVIGNVTNNIGHFSQAIGVAKNKTESNITSINNLAKVMEFAISPTGLLTEVMFILMTTAINLASEINKNNSKIIESSEKLQVAEKEMQNYRNELDKTKDAVLSEVDNTEKLSNELKKLVDENGRVKEGYKERVSFILKELNEALGTEYSMTGNVIDNYKELTETIDTLMQKKRMNAILNNEEEKYNTALENKTAAYDDMISKQKELEQSQIELNKLKEQYYNEETKRNPALYAQIRTQISSQKLATEMAKQNLDKSKNIYQTYLNDIATYENDYAISLKGNTEEINELINSRTYTYQQNSTDIGETINHNIQQAQYEIEQYKIAREKDLQNQDEMNAKKNQNQIEASEKQLRNLTEQLVAMTSTTEQLTPEQVNAWKNLASKSYDIYKEYISKMSPEMKGEIQNITGVIVNDNTVRDATTGLTKEIEEEFNNNVDGTMWGKDLTKEISDSMTSSQSKNWIIGASATVAGWIADYLHHTTPDKGPMKNDDKWMKDFIENLTQGIYSNKYKLLNATENLSQDIKDKLMLSDNNTLQNLEKIQGNVISNAIDNTKTIFTTPKIIFNVQELDENKLEQCFNYINMKFGTKY